MSSTLRLSIIMVLLLATAALGLIAYNNMNPKPVVQVTKNTPAPGTVGYFVAARPLPAGTLARDEDFRSEPLDSVPPGAFRATPDDRIRLRGSLVLKDLGTGSPVTSQDVLLRGDRGFLARVLEPGSRAISINVDQESGVSRLIWPGDYVDVVLTQVIDKADLDKADLVHRAHRTLSETVLHKVRVVAIDQEIVQGGPANNAPANNATAGKVQTVSLQLAPEQVKKITVAEQLGKLSLAVRSAVDQQDTGDTGTMFSCDVSPQIARQNAIARQSATVVVYAGGKVTEYSVKKHDSRDAGSMASCDGSPEVARQSATVVGDAGDKLK
ncbi:MAG: Flp pilus assembly protein CpaB [Candidatus Binataceae bacterium]